MNPRDDISRPGVSFLATKLQLPRLKPGTLHRPRLADLVVNHLDRKLVVITGGAGYGKTTLLAQVREQARLPHVYLALELDDGDFASFYSLMVAGVERLQPGLARRSAELAAGGTDIVKDHRLAMGTLINELVEGRNEELFILLDDYHVLAAGSPVHQALDYFIDRLPATVHVVLASRNEPPLPSLPKWRAKRDAVELPREALRFSEQEIGALLADGYGISPGGEELGRIAGMTEGWITAIHLILQAAVRYGKSVTEMMAAHDGETGDLFRYFAGEIFLRELPETREFLARSSVLETMSPEACRAVLEVGDAAERLRELERRHLFLTVAGAGDYRYHRLFREFLYDQIGDRRVRDSLHLRAARYLLERGEEEKAVDHLLSAGDYQGACRLIGRVRERVVNRARLSLIKSWLERLPDECFLQFPWLYAIQAILHKEQGRLEQAEACYQRAEAAMAKAGPGDPSKAFVLYEKGIVQHRKGEYRAALDSLKLALECCRDGNEDLRISILGFTSQVLLEGMGEPRKARRYLNRARELLKSSTNSQQIVYIEQKEAKLLENLGEKRQAFKVHARIVEQIGDRYSYLAGAYFNSAAKVALDLGKFSWAEECLERGRAVCQGYDDVFSRSMIEFGFGCLRLYQGEWAGARRHLETAHRIFTEMNWSRSVCISLRQLSRLHRYSGDLDRAMEHIALMKQLAPGQIDQVATLLEQSLIEVARRDFAAARKLLEACREPALRFFGKMGEIHCCLAEAEILAGTKRRKDALACFRKSVLLCQEHGFDGLLACELRASKALRELAEFSKGERVYLLSIPSYRPAAAPETEKGRVRVELFGPPRLLVDGNEVTGKLRRQALQLFCYLAHRGESGAGRDEILEAMWPGAGQKRAIDSFHLVVYEVRRGLSDVLGKRSAKAVVRSGSQYRIDPDLGSSVDARDFEQLMGEAYEAERAGDTAAAEDLLERAVGLKTGSFCSGWADDWAQPLDRAYEDRHLKALLKLAALSVKEGALDDGRMWYQKAFELDGLCEEACRGLIRICGVQGKVREAGEIYARLKKSLKKDLDTGPASETVELYESITRGHV